MKELKDFAEFSRHLLAGLGLRPITTDNLVGSIRRLESALGNPPTEESAQKLIVVMTRKGASYSHITNTCVAIEHYMRFLGTPIKLGRPRKPYSMSPKTLSEAEVARLLAASKSLREKAILSLLAYAGTRNRELCGLKCMDIDVCSQMLLIHGGKTQKDRRVPIAAPCAAVLNDYLRERNGKPNDWLFITTREKKQYQPQDLRKMIRGVAIRAGIEHRVYPHLLRHSLATNLLRRGAGVLAIKEQLGHVYLATTMRYIHSDPTLLQQEYRMHAPSYL